MRGAEEGGDHTESDILAVPCHLRETAIGGSKDNILKDCERDPDAVFEYLSNMSTVAWYNYGTFKHGEYEKD